MQTTEGRGGGTFSCLPRTSPSRRTGDPNCLHQDLFFLRLLRCLLFNPTALSMNRKVGQASRLSGSAGFQPAPAGKMPALLHRQDACATCNPCSWPQCMRKNEWGLSMNRVVVGQASRLPPGASRPGFVAGETPAKTAGTAAPLLPRPCSWSQCAQI